MYTLNQTQIASAKKFIDELPDSIVKGKYETWFTAIREDGRLPTEELEKFVSLANGLPQEFQNFPQNFAHSVKNGVDPENAAEVEAKEKAAPKKKEVDKKKKK